MALDGLVISNIVSELNELLTDGRINKISQPENDELLITFKAKGTQIRLLISANPSLPLIYVSKENKPAPMVAPNFCMLLRKHLNSAKIISITQPSLERVIDFKIEHFNDLGDLCNKHLIVELMGKHSNIIFTDDNMNIIDSIKHVSVLVSSVREVLPGRKYFIPDNNNKLNPFDLNRQNWYSIFDTRDITVLKAIYTKITGISPLIANYICNKASIDADTHISQLDADMLNSLYDSFEELMNTICGRDFTPNIIYQKDRPVEFSSVILSGYSTDDYSRKDYESISDALYDYYSQKNLYTRIHQKSSDLRRICQTAIERTSKKLDLQLKQLKDTQKRDKYKTYGDLLMAYSYDVVSGSKSYTCNNFYDDDKEITIPLDPDLSATDNGKKYYEKFAKLKRTYTALVSLVKETEDELYHLESISNELDIAISDSDLNIIKQEMVEYGYIKNRQSGSQKKGNKKNQSNKSLKPMHYVTDNGAHIYVGRNNYQNDELTFKLSSGNDWWFHSKTIAGSHVILKCDGSEPDDKTFEIAASLAAYYSKGRNNDKVEIDYIQRKNVKKPNGAKPGFVIYHTNYSMVAKPDLSEVTLIED